MDFVAIDVETANEQRSSICSIALLKFQDKSYRPNKIKINKRHRKQHLHQKQNQQPYTAKNPHPNKDQATPNKYYISHPTQQQQSRYPKTHQSDT